jgi:cysteinyl-tRNA synthetase
MHNGFLQVEGEKMSKSLGNFVTINELLNGWPGEAVRLNMLKTHYRQPIDWTNERLREADTKVDEWYRSLPDNTIPSKPDATFENALRDDLNTVLAVTRLDELFREVRQLPAHARDERQRLWATIKASANLVGLLEGSFKSNHRLRVARGTRFDLTWDESLQPHIEALISKRTNAREQKDFKESDRIRDELAAMGVMLKDGKDADGKPVTTWEIAR